MSLYLRISHRFGPRMTEWLLAVITALWGLVLLLPATTFEGPSWAFFRSIMAESWWGVFMLFLGLLRIGGLIVNGARKEVTPWIRVFSAGCGFVLFVGIATGFAFSGVIGTWLAVYPVLAAAELVNIYRAAHDAGESHAVP